MNLEQKIQAALHCLEHEYPKGIPADVIDDVTQQLRAEERREWHRRVNAWFAEYRKVATEVSRLMFAERLGVNPRDGSGVPFGQ